MVPEMETTPLMNVKLFYGTQSARISRKFGSPLNEIHNMLMHPETPKPDSAATDDSLLQVEGNYLYFTVFS